MNWVCGVELNSSLTFNRRTYRKSKFVHHVIQRDATTGEIIIEVKTYVVKRNHEQFCCRWKY
jgi:hypothetical protein